MFWGVFLTQYTLWHYGRSIKGYFSVWGNFFWFAWNFFSFSLLVRTLFSPFERLSEEYKKGLDIGAILSSLLVNTIMRFVGAAARLFILVFGAAALILIAGVGVVLLAVWILLPFIVVALALLGVQGVLLWV